jgi:hypothetical protein
VSEKTTSDAQTNASLSQFTQETLEFLTFLSKLTQSLSGKADGGIEPDPYMQVLMGERVVCVAFFGSFNFLFNVMYLVGLVFFSVV